MPKICGRLYLVDGDNHVYEGLKGVFNSRKTDSVIVYVTQDGLAKKLRKKYEERVSVKEVPPGDQAVDNVIKSRMGSEAALGRYAEVVVLSRDKGYEGQIRRNLKAGATKFTQAGSISGIIMPQRP